MTKRKQQPPSRLYDTFSSSDSASRYSDQPYQSPTSYQSTGDSDKSRSAAAEARRLGSMGSWGDRLSGGTPTTDLTPDASTVHGDDDDDDNNQQPRAQYRRQHDEADPSDPPPLYTPAESSSPAPSPLIMRAMIDDDHYQRVSLTPNTTSPLLPTQQQHSSEHQFHGPSSEDDDDEIEHGQDIDEFVDPYSDSLPEPVQHSRRHERRRSSGNGTHLHHESDTQCNSWKRKRRGCVSRRGRHWHSHGPPHSHEGRKARAQRFKRSCCFILSLLACLWLMIPGLCKSFADNSGNTEVPTTGNTKPPASSFPPPSREYHQHETYQSISGTYKLYDLLDLSTTAGSISITVDVQPGDQPARLQLATTAGSINVRMVQSSGPSWRWLNWLQPDNKDSAKNSTDNKIKNLNRTFINDLTSKAGSVSGNIIHGNGGTTSVSTLAGSISISIYTTGVSGSDPVSKLTTNTNSGSQNIRIVSPEFSSTTGRASIPAVRAIQALHRTTGSGSIHVKYPAEWEGQLYIDQKGSGSISATGNGLEIERRSGHDLLGWKGMNPSDAQSVEIRELGSGSIHFEV